MNRRSALLGAAAAAGAAALARPAAAPSAGHDESGAEFHPGDADIADGARTAAPAPHAVADGGRGTQLVAAE